MVLTETTYQRKRYLNPQALDLTNRFNYNDFIHYKLALIAKIFGPSENSNVQYNEIRTVREMRTKSFLESTKKTDTYDRIQTFQE